MEVESVEVGAQAVGEVVGVVECGGEQKAFLHHDEQPTGMHAGRREPIDAADLPEPGERLGQLRLPDAESGGDEGTQCVVTVDFGGEGPERAGQRTGRGGLPGKEVLGPRLEFLPRRNDGEGGLTGKNRVELPVDHAGTRSCLPWK